MTPYQIDLVQRTFDQVLPAADVAAATFYGRLFELDPSLRTLFRGDMRMQGRKLMHALSVIVNNLRKPDLILPGISAMGVRHVAYGVRDEHYETVGAALLSTLGSFFGTGFTRELHDAWAAAYNIVAGAMKSAAAQHQAEAVSA